MATDELLDLVNDQDQVIGQIGRYEALSKGIKNIRVAHLFVFTPEGKIIVPVRSANRKMYPNCYDFSTSGYVGAGESYDEGIKRETEEELGITGVNLEPIGHLSPNELGTSSFSMIYRLVYDGELNYDKKGIAEILQLEPQEIAERIKREPERFKGDFILIFNWLFSKNFGSIKH